MRFLSTLAGFLPDLYASEAREHCHGLSLKDDALRSHWNRIYPRSRGGETIWCQTPRPTGDRALPRRRGASFANPLASLAKLPSEYMDRLSDGHGTL